MIEELQKYTMFKDEKILFIELLQNQGYCNENYLLTTEKKKYILRKFLRTDIDRNFEFEIQKLAYEHTITAEPIILEDTFIVSEFLEGTHLNKLPKQELKKLAEVLKTLHTIEIDKDPIELHITIKTDEVKEALDTITTYEKEYVLCHNDLNPQNIFFTDKVKLIDWEYAGVNDRYFDLACVCVEFDLNKKDEAYFLGSYFARGYKVNYEKHNAYKVIYKALCSEWFNKLAK